MEVSSLYFIVLVFSAGLNEGGACFSKQKPKVQINTVTEEAKQSSYTYIGTHRRTETEALQSDGMTLGDETRLASSDDTSLCPEIPYMDVVLPGLKPYFFPLHGNDQETYKSVMSVRCQKNQTQPDTEKTLVTLTPLQTGFKTYSWRTYNSFRDFIMDANNYDVVLAQMYATDILKHFGSVLGYRFSLSVASFVNEMTHVHMALDTLDPSPSFAKALHNLDEVEGDLWMKYHAVLSEYGSEVVRTAVLGSKVVFFCLHSGGFSFSPSSTMDIDYDMTLEAAYKSWLGRIDKNVVAKAFAVEGFSFPPNYTLREVSKLSIQNPVVLAYHGLPIADLEVVPPRHRKGLQMATQYDRLHQQLKQFDVALRYNIQNNVLRKAAMTGLREELLRVQPRKEVLDLAKFAWPVTAERQQSISCGSKHEMNVNGSYRIRFGHKFNLYPLTCTTDPQIQDCVEWINSSGANFPCIHQYMLPSCAGNPAPNGVNGNHTMFFNSSSPTLSLALCDSI